VANDMVAVIAFLLSCGKARVELNQSLPIQRQDVVEQSAKIHASRKAQSGLSTLGCHLEAGNDEHVWNLPSSPPTTKTKNT
jgi:hypothetical protein